MSKTLNVLYGTESGNSEKLAKSLEFTAKEIAKTLKFEVLCKNIKDLKVSDLASMSYAVIVISTWGEGDPPATCEKFCKELYAASSPDLSSLQYALLAMGDKSYQDFCACGRRVDESISRLGAKSIMPRQDMDLDFDTKFEAWEIDFFAKLGALFKN